MIMFIYIYVLYDECIEVLDLSTFNSLSCHYISTKYSIIVIVDRPIVRLEHQWALINSLIQMIQLYHTYIYSCACIYVWYDEYIEVLDLSTFNSMSCHYSLTKYSILVTVGILHINNSIHSFNHSER